jgi:hypothetical protein
MDDEYICVDSSSECDDADFLNSFVIETMGVI